MGSLYACRNSFFFSPGKYYVLNFILMLLLQTVNVNRMELEDVHSDLCSLRKLYGLLQGSPEGVQMAGFVSYLYTTLLCFRFCY